MGKFVTISLCCLFIISPIDLMPELVLGPLGLGDDLVAFIIAVRTFLHSEPPKLDDHAAK